MTHIAVTTDEWLEIQQRIKLLEIDRDLWKETADDWRQDALRYREALKDIRRNLGCALPDECLDLHSDPKDSDIHNRIRKFLDGPNQSEPLP